MNEFIPEPYCSTQDALKIVYRHLFSEPCNDAEINAALKARVEKIRIRADGMTESDLLSRGRLVLGGGRIARADSMTPQERLSAQIKAARSDADILEDYAKRIREPLFLDISEFLPPDPKLEIKAGRVAIGRSVAVGGIRPELADLAAKRWGDVVNTMRAKLYSGDIVAFLPSAYTGMTPFMTCNYWLDDKKAVGSLKQGGLRFNKDELLRLFPTSILTPLQADAPTESKKKANRPNEYLGIAGFLLANFSSGRPEGLSSDAKWLELMNEQNGWDVKIGVFSKAKVHAFGAKKSPKP